MSLRIHHWSAPLDYSEASLRQALSDFLGEPRLAERAGLIRVERRSLDARGRELPHYVLELALDWPYQKRYARLKGVEEAAPTPAPYVYPRWCGERPIVVGSGPAGLMAAYELALAGAKPLIIERGAAVEERALAVQRYWQGGPLDPESNVQFGEGGAGTFSDGKLTTRIKDSLVGLVIERFQRWGAAEEILIAQKPHIGTDCLREILRRMRAEIEALGGSYLFHCRFEGLILDAERRLRGIHSSQGDFPCRQLFLGLGHSARDSFRRLADDGLALEAKPFAVGFRIEHPQSLIDRARYGRHAGHPLLPAAEYQLAVAGALGRRVYSFCMCPGGEVVASASGSEQIVSNGMSYQARAAANANSAILCPVDQAVYGSGLWDGLIFQEKLEAKAYHLSPDGHAAPAELQVDFLQGLERNLSSAWASVQPSYQPGVQATDLRQLFPPALNAAFQAALPQMARLLPGFDLPEAVLTGPESRSSSPLRLLREPQSRQSVNTPGVYPIGEGAGYAGGISSSAVDGIRSARALLDRLKTS